MPLPKPRTDEEHDAFISRCHSALADEFGDQDQRHAVCETQWRTKHGGEAPKAMSHDRASVPFELKALDSETKRFTGLAATWDLDLQGDRIEPGAFKETARHWNMSKKLPILDSHSRKSMLDAIGEVESLEETQNGLLIHGKLLETEDTDKYWARLKSGIVNTLSIGYKTQASRPETKEVGGQRKRIRVLTKVRLFEISPVIYGANPNALILAAKGLLEDEDKESVVAIKNQLDEILAGEEGESDLEAEPKPEPAPNNDEADSGDEEDEKTEPSPEQEVLASLEAELEEYLERKETARQAEDYIEAAHLNAEIKGLEARVLRQKRRVREIESARGSWAVNGKDRLEAEALLAATSARAV